MLFPVILEHKSKFALSFFSLTPRARDEYLLGDNLFASLGPCPEIADLLMRLSRGHFPEALRLKIEWEREEKERLAALFNLRPDFPLRGDSWYLPLFFLLLLFQAKRLAAENYCKRRAAALPGLALRFNRPRGLQAAPGSSAGQALFSAQQQLPRPEKGGQGCFRLCALAQQFEKLP